MNTAVAAAPLTITRRIDASVADVWRAWTDAALLARWFAPGSMRAEVTELETRKGGGYRICMHDDDGSVHTVRGRFEDVQPERRLAMSWAWEGNENVVSQVTVLFSAKDGGTELHIVHEGLPDADSAGKHNEGWLGCLANLESRIAGFPGA